MRACILDRDHHVVNVIVVDDLDFDPGDGLTLVGLTDEPVSIGDTYKGGTWSTPPTVDPAAAAAAAPTRAELLDLVESLTTRVAALEDAATAPA